MVNRSQTAEDRDRFLEIHSDAYRVLDQAIANRAFPGCAFGILAQDGISFSDALGRFTYDDNAPAVHANTIYDVASLTKVVSTTATAMLLHQQLRLNLETRLGDLLPGFVIGRAGSDATQSRWARQVTLRHLLAHTSGLPGYVPLFRRASSPFELLRATLQLPLEAEPGTRAEYSDHGFILLGKALECLLGEPLAPWASRHIFAPLAMASTRFCPLLSQRATIPPTEEDHTLRHRTIQGEVQDEHAFLLHGAPGHAGLFSNAPDLLRFAHAILHPEQAALFDPATIALFSQRQSPLGSSRALGWDTPSTPSSSGSLFSTRSIGHLGYSGCSLWIDLEARIAIVLLTNRTWPDRLCDAIRSVRPAFHDAIRNALS
uniref:Beta-lactamase n=1 Tax=mine drainage metagenome TaxID=410659 RepID=E6QIH5_9ZZZZ